jgi:hypothetical protein
LKTKLLLLFSLVLITLISVNSCKKDYPRDIPDWLKEKIKERKEYCERPGGCYCNDGSGLCWTIDEYNQNGETKFVKIENKGEYTHGIVSVYKFDGNLECIDVAHWQSEYDTVCNCILQSLKVREIWKERY